MPAADRIFGVLDVLVEACRIMILDEVHALPIQLFDALPYLPIVLVVVGELKAASPVTEVAADDEQRIRLLEVRLQQLCIVLFHFGIGGSHHDGNQLHLISQHLFQVG